MTHIGKKIRQERKLRGMTQEDLAVELGVTHNTVARWEQKRHEPTGLSRRVVEEWLEKD